MWLIWFRLLGESVEPESTPAPPPLPVHEQPVRVVAELPVLERVKIHLAVPCTPAVQLAEVTATVAVLVNDPKRPKTKPAMAMAAMSVIAIRITVARTGEMALSSELGM